jgi:hypothetical protein
MKKLQETISSEIEQETRKAKMEKESAIKFVFVFFVFAAKFREAVRKICHGNRQKVKKLGLKPNVFATYLNFNA